MANLYEKNFDSVEMDNLFAGTEIPVIVKSVKLAAGQGILKRGTVLGIVSATKEAIAVDSVKSDGGEKADCILTDTVDTTGDDPIVTTAYSSGLFNRNALTFGGSDTAEKHETRLRELGIFLKDNITY